MDLTSSPDLAGWTPIRVAWRDGRPIVDWCHTEGVAFTDPFFAETVECCLRHPFRLLFRHQTTMEETGRFVAGHPGLPLAGIVLHMSRCGSTLVSQMLATAPEHLVLSEPGPVDSVLRARDHLPDITGDEHATWLRWIVAAMSQRRGPQIRAFLKLDAWSAMELPLIRRAFPDVPWLFLFRDPVEVLASQSRRLGAHVIPGVLPPAAFGLDPESIPGMDLMDYAARVLGRICEAALEWEHDPLATFADYRQLPELVWSRLLPAWSITPTDEEVARMSAAASRDAKNPFVPFVPDGAARRTAAPPNVVAAADRWLRPSYERLLAAQLAGDRSHGR